MSIVVLMYDKINMHAEALEAMVCVFMVNLDSIRPNKLANSDPELMIDGQKALIQDNLCTTKSVLQTYSGIISKYKGLKMDAEGS